jgi:hypothetical protein
VREFGPQAGRDTQLTFAGDLALRLSTQAGVLGFARTRSQDRRTGTGTPPCHHGHGPSTIGASR